MKKYLKLGLCLLLLLSVFGCSLIDDVTPTITIQNEELHLECDEFYDYYDNVAFEFGILGGKIDFKTEISDEYTLVKVEAVGNNGLSSTGEFKIKYSNTENKNALFIGDSIVDGYQANMYSYADYIRDDYDFGTVVVAARSGAFLTPAERNLISVLKSHKNDQTDYDYVILEGGINDIINLRSLGQISDSYDVNDLNGYTYIGAFEKYLYYATTYWPNARIGYIVNYYTCGWSTDGIRFSKDYYSKFYEAQREVLKKWNVDYLDLFTEEYDEIFDVTRYTYLPDHLHLNTKGQQLLRDIVLDWMVTIPRYNTK